VKDLKAKRANPELVGDVEVYAHAGNPPVADQGQIQLDCFGRIL